jgi:hypothetical protein
LAAQNISIWDGGIVVWRGEEASPTLLPAGIRQPAADPAVRVRVSACRPGPELVGVEYGSDVLDPDACDVERVHRHGGAIQLSHQAGWPLNRALQDRQAGSGPIKEEACDLLGAFAPGRRPCKRLRNPSASSSARTPSS